MNDDDAMVYYKSFQDRSEVLLGAFRGSVLSLMPDKGDTEETSQKIAILNALNNLEATVNGTTVEDFS